LAIPVICGGSTFAAGLDYSGALRAKVASAQDSFARGQATAARNTLEAMRNEISAQAGKKLDVATAATLRRLSADAVVLLGAG
jgi:hypothetical protein